MIELKNVVKVYNADDTSVKALDNISIKIDDGEYIAVMGRSGSGKSTLLNIIGGMEKVSSGQYFCNEKEISSLTIKELDLFRKNNISFVFQNYFLINTYTVSENIEVPLIAKGIPAKKRKNIVDEMMKKTGISDIAKKYPNHISGGQMQRCAIARALASDNSIILADEPTGNLDSKTSQDVLGLLKVTGKCFHQTIVMITHNEEIAQ
ncbi:ABC transporter ATP-binding protein, partial [Eshraghiella crossota]|uniref:ABC transporter ATP-binding protein n=1 Tax=Eshraghiella crossota TaxID=45851 RepID=UPI003F821FF1